MISKLLLVVAAVRGSCPCPHLDPKLRKERGEKDICQDWRSVAEAKRILHLTLSSPCFGSWPRASKAQTPRSMSADSSTCTSWPSLRFARKDRRSSGREPLPWQHYEAADVYIGALGKGWQATCAKICSSFSSNSCRGKGG